MMVPGFSADAEYLAELGGGDDDRGSVDETQYNRMRQEIQEDTETQHAHEQLEHSDHQGQ